MAKRFIDTGLFDDEWFAELKPESKIFWIYYLTKCDHAGLLKFNKKLIEFQTGIKSLDIVIKEIGARLVKVNEQLFFCPKFIQFQYPNFPKSGVKQQDSAIELLIKNGLWDSETHEFIELDNCMDTVTKDLNKSYDNGNVNGNGYKEKKSEKISLPFESEAFASAWNDWLKYRAQIKKPYRSDLSKQWALTHLSKYPEEVAISMIHQSIKNQWQGIFDVKDDPPEKGSPKKKLTLKDLEQ